MQAHFSRFAIIVTVLLVCVCAACDETNDSQPLTITGHITTDKTAAEGGGDIYASVLKGGGREMMSRDLSDSFESMTRTAPDGSFSLDLSGTGLAPGDTVTLIGFLDRNGNGGIPTPDAGDAMGFFIEEGTLTPSYTLKPGVNSGVDIRISREVFDFDKEISGTITGGYTGPVHLFAYAGDIRSLDLSALDVDNIIGYASVEKNETPLDYRLTILPYGHDLPIADVTVMAIFDTNENGSLDPGESVAYHSQHPKGLPTLLTLTTAEQDGISLDSDRAMVLPVPAGEAISLSGQVEPPDGYDAHSAPLFVLVAETDDPNILLTHPLSVTRAFYRLDPAAVDFNLDVSATGLAPGDTVMVLALWDKNFKENPDTPTYTSFPDATDGDLLGYYQDKDTLTVAHPLRAGVNAFVPQAEGNIRFDVNRRVIDHSASLAFKVENGGGVTVNAGDTLLVISIEKEGLRILPPALTDPDRIVTMASVTATGDSDHTYAVPVMGALLDEIIKTPFGVEEVYVIAVLDANQNGKPDTGEALAFYPGILDLIDGTNTLDSPVKFTVFTI
ncbi:hypothetical protein [Desulfoluna spongiiphila]|uniref:Uncharacterized protein n=1 Tax=Desulfoluna spongiiphila TaxID=419481 RepID=A0A1G5ER66_9BACT|nr:hypothetical protein [Desulfoluna spongiiphila]SCY29505.1 hypothetical protein SAMN05216233_106175 [Desulfoluna spongiiphila]